MNDNVLVWDLATFLRSNVNNPEFQEYWLNLTRELLVFLEKNDLIKEESLRRIRQKSNNILIMEGDLKPLGVLLNRDQAFYRWLAANDDIRRPISMRSLERSLKKLSNK